MWLCNSIKILTALQPYLTLKLSSSKRHNKLLVKGVRVLAFVCISVSVVPDDACVFLFVCLCVRRCARAHVITLRARYGVTSISCLLRLWSCFYYRHHNGGVCGCMSVCVYVCVGGWVVGWVPFNISPSSLPLLILGLRFMILYYICLVTLIHPSHTATCTHTCSNTIKARITHVLVYYIE